MRSYEDHSREHRLIQARWKQQQIQEDADFRAETERLRREKILNWVGAGLLLVAGFVLGKI